MRDEESKDQDSYIKAISSIGGPTRPIHISSNSWEEATYRLADSIRSNNPFEGNWQSYVSNFRLVIPEELRELFSVGGVLTVSTENHLMLFGSKHWELMQRKLSKEIGLSPVHNEVPRHIYRHVHRFSALGEDSAIDIPLKLVEYAGITKEVVIIGMVYYAEIHDKAAYMQTQQKEERVSLLDRFRKIRFNQ